MKLSIIIVGLILFFCTVFGQRDLGDDSRDYNTLGVKPASLDPCSPPKERIGGKCRLPKDYD